MKYLGGKQRLGKHIAPTLKTIINKVSWLMEFLAWVSKPSDVP